MALTATADPPKMAATINPFLNKNGRHYQSFSEQETSGKMKTDARNSVTNTQLRAILLAKISRTVPTFHNGRWGNQPYQIIKYGRVTQVLGSDGAD
jgi:hypothetical protein